MNENNCENDSDDDDCEDDSEILDEDEFENFEFERDFVVEVKMEDENKK